MKDYIPVLHVEGISIAAAYEEALVELYKRGIEIKTQYDKPEDPPSIDATMNITVWEPFSEPMIHKAFPGGIEDLREYVMELEGAKDHWVRNMDDPDDTRWEYTYHQRLANWGIWKGGPKDDSYEIAPFGESINQIQIVIDKLIKNPYTRRAQMITWMPFMDNGIEDPACLQSLHYRITGNKLNCNVRFRSNDAWGASFMNMFGFVFFNRGLILEPLKKNYPNLELGRMNWHADSYHIYGKDLDVFRDRFYNRLNSRFDERTYNFTDHLIQEIWEESEKTIIEKIKKYDETHK